MEGFLEGWGEYDPETPRAEVLWKGPEGRARSGPSRFAAGEGRQACAAGIARRAFPWRQAQRVAPRQGREGIRPGRRGAGWLPTPASTAMTSPAGSAHRARTGPKVRWDDKTR